MRAPIIAVVCLAPVLAVADTARPLTLAEAQVEARSHAPRATALATKLAGAEAIAHDRRRRLRTDPELSASYTTGAPSGDLDEQSIGIGFDWALDLSGAWRDLRDAAATDRDRAEASRDDGRLALDEAVAIAVADLASAQRALDRADRIVALQQIAHAAAVRLLDTSKGTQLDVDAAELDLAAARADREGAKTTRERAQIGLARLLGRADHAGLLVADPVEEVTPPSESDVDAQVSADPRVRAADAAARAAGLELSAADRSALRPVSLGLDVEYARHDIPSGSFTTNDALAASWKDWEVGVRLSVPLPLFDRRREIRTRARVQVSDLAAVAAVVRADVRAELKDSAAELRGAIETWKVLADTAATLEREYDLLDKAFRAGALDVTARAQSARRLLEAGTRLDTALRDLRVARAHWVRRTSR